MKMLKPEPVIIDQEIEKRQNRGKYRLKYCVSCNISFYEETAYNDLRKRNREDDGEYICYDLNHSVPVLVVISHFSHLMIDEFAGVK